MFSYLLNPNKTRAYSVTMEKIIHRSDKEYGGIEKESE